MTKERKNGGKNVVSPMIKHENGGLYSYSCGAVLIHDLRHVTKGGKNIKSSMIRNMSGKF